MSFNCTIGCHHAFFKKKKVSFKCGVWNLVFLINALNVFKYLSTCDIPYTRVLRYFFLLSFLPQP